MIAIIIILANWYSEKVHGRLNHDVLLMLQGLDANLFGNDVIEDFGDSATVAAQGNFGATQISWQSIITRALAKTYRMALADWPGNGGARVIVRDKTRQTLVNALIYANGALPVVGQGAPAGAAAAIAALPQSEVAAVINPFGVMYDHIVERRHLWTLPAGGAAAQHNQHFVSWCRAARVNAGDYEGTHSAFAIPVGNGAAGFLAIINSLELAARNLANITVTPGGSGKVIVDVNISGLVGGAALTMLKCNLFLRDAPALPDVDKIYSQCTQNMLKGWVSVPQPPVLNATLLLGAAAPVAPAVVAAPAIAPELNGIPDITIRETMRIAALQKYSKRDPVYVAAEAAAVLACAKASHEAIITSPLGAEMLRPQIPQTAAVAGPAVTSDIVLQTAVVTGAGVYAGPAFGGATVADINTAIGQGAAGAPVPIPAIAGAPGVPAHVIRIVISSNGEPVTMYPM